METSKERLVARRLRNRNISKEDGPMAAKKRRTGNSGDEEICKLVQEQITIMNLNVSSTDSTDENLVSTERNSGFSSISFSDEKPKIILC